MESINAPAATVRPETVFDPDPEVGDAGMSGSDATTSPAAVAVTVAGDESMAPLYEIGIEAVLGSLMTTLPGEKALANVRTTGVAKASDPIIVFPLASSGTTESVLLAGTPSVKADGVSASEIFATMPARIAEN